MNISLFYVVEPDYLKAMGIPLERGRFFTDQDNEHAPVAIVIDEYFAKKFFPNQDPIGKRVNLEILGSQPEIIGVAGHVKHWGLDSDAAAPIQAQFYIALMQVPDRFMTLLSSPAVVVRAERDPLALTNAIRAAVSRVSTKQVVYSVETMNEIIADSLAARRFSMILLAIFAGLALVLSTIGIYGVISYIVGQRTHEIGIRMALGAQQSDVMSMVIKQGAQMALIGVGIGLVAAFGLTRQMNKMLYGVSATDALTFVGVAVVLVSVALLACYIPARRAMRVDPLVALRYE
jgi:predicted permease